MSRKVTTISDRVAMERCLRNMLKDQLKRIKELKAEIEIKQATIDYMAKDNKIIQDLILNLQQQLKDNTKQVCEKIIDRMQNIEFNCDTDFQSMISILDQIENENV